MLVAADRLLGPHWPAVDRRVHLMVSGGPDSMALLALVSDFSKVVPRKVIVHYCHHGVAAEANNWGSFILSEAQRRGFAFRVHHLNLELGPEFEARARELRYQRVKREVTANEIVLTAHHRDDQIETILIRLSQGSGLIGLGGIPISRTFGRGLLVRPLLSVSRKQLMQVLTVRNLKYIKDPSNQDPSYLRNFIRLQFLPALASVAPGIGDKLLELSKVAMGRTTQAAARLGKHLPVPSVEFVDIAPTEALIAWQVRFFAQNQACYAPSSSQISEFARQCLEAADDRSPEVPVGPDAVIRRWGDKLYWIDSKNLGDEASNEIVRFEKLVPKQLVELRFPNGILTLRTGAVSEDVSIFWGVEGRSFRRGRNRPLQSLKQLAQTLGVPPWLRKRTPVVAISDQIIGWCDIDCRECGLIPHSLHWRWRFVTRNGADSSVS